MGISIARYLFPYWGHNDMDIINHSMSDCCVVTVAMLSTGSADVTRVITEGVVGNLSRRSFRMGDYGNYQKLLHFGSEFVIYTSSSNKMISLS